MVSVRLNHGLYLKMTSTTECTRDAGNRLLSLQPHFKVSLYYLLKWASIPPYCVILVLMFFWLNSLLPGRGDSISNHDAYMHLAGHLFQQLLLLIQSYGFFALLGIWLAMYVIFYFFSTKINYIITTDYLIKTTAFSSTRIPWAHIKIAELDNTSFLNRFLKLTSIVINPAPRTSFITKVKRAIARPYTTSEAVNKLNRASLDGLLLNQAQKVLSFINELKIRST